MNFLDEHSASVRRHDEAAIRFSHKRREGRLNGKGFMQIDRTV
jgi:hypothetical protein